jgi:hypothetical protein
VGGRLIRCPSAALLLAVSADSAGLPRCVQQGSPEPASLRITTPVEGAGAGATALTYAIWVKLPSFPCGEARLSTVLASRPREPKRRQLPSLLMFKAPGRLLTAVLAAALLAACGGDPQPGTLPVTPVTPVTPATPSGQAPDEPLDAAPTGSASSTSRESQTSQHGNSPTTSSTPAPTSQGSGSRAREAEIEKAVRRYYAAISSAMATGDTRSLEEATTDDCSCARVVKSISTLRKEGKSFRGGTFHVNMVEVQDLFGRTAAAEVKYAVAPYDVLNDQGKVVNHYDAQENLVHVSLQEERGGWIVNNVFRLDPS